MIRTQESLPSMKKIQDSDGALILVGDDYQDTKNLPFGTILLFLERDIIQARKHQFLPNIKMRLTVRKAMAYPEIQVEIQSVEGVTTPPLTRNAPVFVDDSFESGVFLRNQSSESQNLLRYVHHKLNLILWRYNFFKVDAEGKNFEIRYLFRIFLADSVRRRLESPLQLVVNE